MIEGKKYPRIFSLATAGIKYHGYQDYIFHPLRTDFVGDSGFGKSMIGDMLQLIFVGAGAFRSATDRTREPKGMVLPQSERSGIGYIFLNIELEHEKYVVIGDYIDSARGVSPFIIQSGYNWEGALIPFSHPMSYALVTQGNKLLPIDDFENVIEHAGDRAIKVFRNNTRQFHQVLVKNSILPIDFGENKKRLEDYVQILHSFARGQSFKRDSASLKNFLFGSEEAEELLKDFQRDKENLQMSLEEYERNKKDVEEVEAINDELLLLQDLERERDVAQKIYLMAEVTHFYQQLRQLNHSIDELSKKVAETTWQLLIVEQEEKRLELNQKEEELTNLIDETRTLEQLRQDLEASSQELDDLTHEKDSLEEIYSLHRDRKQKLETAQNWLTSHSESLEQLKQSFDKQNRNIMERQQLTDFVEYLETQSLMTDFMSSIWPHDFDEAKQESAKRILELDEELKLLEAVKVFSDVENSNSLAHWIFEREEPITPEQESILIHFQNLSRSEGIRREGERYLPQPGLLFDQRNVSSQDSDGFWFKLGAIYEFISSRPQQLGKVNRTELKEYLARANVDATTKYEALAVEKQRLEQLRESLSERREQVSLFQRKSEVEAFEISYGFARTPEELTELLQLLNQSADIKTEFDKTHHDYEALEQRVGELKTRSTQLDTKIGIKKKALLAKNTDELEAGIASVKTELADLQQQCNEIALSQQVKSDLEDKIKRSLKEELLKNDSVRAVRIIRDPLNQDKGGLGERLEQLRKQYPEIEAASVKAQAAYEEMLEIKFEPNEEVNHVNPEEARERFQIARNNFSNKFVYIVDKRIKNDAHLFQNSTDIGFLAHHLLPKIFTSPKAAELGIAKGIADHLKSINEKNHQINQGKAQFLADAFEKVRERYDHYSKLVGELRKFFRGDGTQITGGYRVSLGFSASKDYPIDWIGDLRRSLNEWKIGRSELFRNDNDSLDDIISETFRNRVGYSKETPDIKTLLDPKSYFDLSFDLESDRGTTQGSTGQAYTAIALLCIARLSLIEERQKQGVRFMPIDEAEGIGSNYETLYNLALKYDYQVVSMSIRNVEGVQEGKQNIYMLNPNSSSETGINHPPSPFLEYGGEQLRKWKGVVGE